MSDRFWQIYTDNVLLINSELRVSFILFNYANDETGGGGEFKRSSTTNAYNLEVHKIFL